GPASPKLGGPVASEGGPASPKLGGPVASEGGRTTWSDFGGGPDNARYLTLEQINRSNVDQLAVAWTYPTRDNISYVFNPIVVDNVMYVRSEEHTSELQSPDHIV